MVAAIFGFALATAYCPWITGAASTPRWIVLVMGAMAILVPSMTRTRLPPRDFATVPCLWGWAFLAWGLVMLGFSPAMEAIDQAWKLCLYAVLFMAGGLISSLRPFYAGAAAGLAISSVLVMGDLAGLISYQQVSPPSGLFVNGLYLAEFSAMVIAALMAEAMPHMVMLCVPAMMLGSVARGPILALGVAGTIAVLQRWRSRPSEAFVTMALLTIAALLLVLWRPATVWARIDLWLAMLPHITLTGRGLGAFFADGPLMSVYVNESSDGRPLHANNDLIEIGYDLGVVGVVLAIGFVVSLLRRPWSAESFVVIVFMVEGCFGFPFYLPWSAGLFCLAAGHLARHSDLRVRAPDDSGVEIFDRYGSEGSAAIARSPDGRGGSIPVAVHVPKSAGDAA